MINEIENARNLVEPKLAYAIRRLHTHSSTNVRTWDSKKISKKNNQNKNPSYMKNAYTDMDMYASYLMRMHLKAD